MDKKTLLAIVLSLAVLLVYQMFFATPPKPQQAPAGAGEAQQVQKEAAIKPATPGVIATAKKTAVKREIASRDIKVKEGSPFPLAITFPESSENIAADSMFEANAARLNLLGAKEKQRLVFSGVYNGIMKVEKIYTFDPDHYTIVLDVKMYNLTGTPLIQIPRLSWQQYVDPQRADDTYGPEGPVVSVAKSIERQEVKTLDKEIILGPNVLWGGFESKYFIASFIPENPSLTSVIMNRDAQNMVSVGIKGQKEVIPAGQSSIVSYSLYLGPKEHGLLNTLKVW